MKMRSGLLAIPIIIALIGLHASAQVVIQQGVQVGVTSFSGVASDGANGLTIAGNLSSPNVITKGTPTFDVRAYGAKLDGVTDDTAALQNAVNACFAASGSLYIPAVGGQLHLGGTINGACDALICAPSVAATSPSQQCDIHSNIENQWVGSNFNPSGVIQTAVSAGTDANSAIFGVPSVPGNFGNFDNVLLKIHDISFLTYPNPAIGGVNCGSAGSCEVYSFTYSVGQPYSGTHTQPTNNRTGVILPLINNWGKSVLHDAIISGVYTGFEISEHADVQNVNTNVTQQGMVTTHGYHAAHIKNLNIQEAVTPIVATGGVLPLSIQNLDLEIDPNQTLCTWCYSTTDISDPSNLLYGQIIFTSITAGNGNLNSLRVNGGSNLYFGLWTGGPVNTLPPGNQTITEANNNQFFVIGNAASFTNPFFVVQTNQSGAGFLSGMAEVAPNMTTGGSLTHSFGASLGTNLNSASLTFNYAGGSGSTANYGSLSLYSVNNILNFFGTGHVVLGSATDCGQTLCITGNIVGTGSLKLAAARKGTFVCTAGGTITISNSNETATSDVIISLNAQGGTITTPPAMKTVTAATGFTVLCGASDTSTYNYDILN